MRGEWGTGAGGLRLVTSAPLGSSKRPPLSLPSIVEQVEGTEKEHSTEMEGRSTWQAVMTDAPIHKFRGGFN